MNIAIIQAHMGSTRLPGKVMNKLVGKEVLLHVYERCLHAKKLDKVVVATSKDRENNIIESLCKNNNIECFRGSEEDVLDRYYQCAIKYNADIIVRVTSDCPLLEPKLIDFWIENMEIDNVEFIEEEKDLFTGFGVDIFNMNALIKLKNFSTKKKQKEHVVGYYLDNKDNFVSKRYTLEKSLNYLYRNYRLTLDTKEDYVLISSIYDKFYNDGFIDLEKVMYYIDSNRDVININKDIKQRIY